MDFFSFLELNSNAASDSDYTVIDKGDTFYIKYKKYEFEIFKKNFNSNSLSFKDKNNRFVPFSTRYEIINYIHSRYENEIYNYSESNLIPIKDLVNDFYSIRLATKEEIDDYIKEKGTKPFKASNKPLGIVLLIIGFLCFSVSTAMDDNNFVKFLIVFTMSIILFIIGIKKLITPKAKDNLYEKVINGTVYIADAYVYDKDNYIQNGDRERLVRIWDRHNHCLDKRFSINVSAYHWDEIKGHLYLIKYNNEEILDFILVKPNN